MVFAEDFVVFAEVAATFLDFEVVVVYLVASFSSPYLYGQVKTQDPPTS